MNYLSVSNFGTTAGPGASRSWFRRLISGQPKPPMKTAVQNRPGEAILLCDRARIILRTKEW